MGEGEGEKVLDTVEDAEEKGTRVIFGVLLSGCCSLFHLFIICIPIPFIYFSCLW